MGNSSRPRATSASSLRAEEGGDPTERKCVHIEHGTPKREGGGTPNQEDMEGAPPEQRALLVHSMQERKEEATTYQDAEGGVPSEQRVLPAHGM